MRRAVPLLLLLALATPRPASAAEGSVIRVITRPPAEGEPRPPPEAAEAPGVAEAPEIAEAPEATKAASPEPLPRLPPARAARPAAPDLTLGAAPPRDGPRVLPWVSLGASAVLGAVGAVFAMEAASGLDGEDFELVIEGDRAVLPDDFRDAQARVVDNTIISTALLSTAAAGALMSVILLLEDA